MVMDGKPVMRKNFCVDGEGWRGSVERKGGYI